MSPNPSATSSSAYAGFWLDKPRYDQSTYMGRVRHFFGLIDPMAMFTSEKQIKSSQALLQQFKEGRLDPVKTTVEDLWKARNTIEAVLHPQSGEPINPVFRMAAFVPVNLPIAATMMMLPQTVPIAIAGQWINQTYNAGFNYSNRNTSNPDSTSAIMKSYFSACMISCGMAVGLGEMVKRSGGRGGALMSRAVPWIAVTSAGVFNAVIMRLSEATEGIVVFDKNGDEVGKSQKAGKIALAQIALTRAAISSAALLFPNVTIHLLGKTTFMTKFARFRIPIELGVIGAYLWLALPFAVGMFPQNASVPVSWLEPRFQGLKDKKAQPVETVFFNKGI